MYVLVDFICMGLLVLELGGSRTENYKMKNLCPQWDSNPVIPLIKANALNIALRDLIPIESIKVNRLLPVLLKITCSKLIYHLFLS